MCLIVSDERDDRSKTPTLQSVAWHSCRKMIYVPRSVQKGTPVGFWPLPEGFWPDLTSTSLVSAYVHSSCCALAEIAHKCI